MATVILEPSDFDDIVRRVTEAVLEELRRNPPPETVRYVSADGAKCRSPADKMFGYELGCDGLVKLKEAQSILGGISRTTVWRLSKDGKIRGAKVFGRKRYCRRSLLNHLKLHEV